MDLLELFQRLNSERTNPLMRDSRLDTLAQDHCEWMFRKRRLTHFGNGFQSPGKRIRGAGIAASLTGEIIAVGQPSPENVMKSWMSSRGHKANITNENFTDCGISYHNRYWCVIFIKRIEKDENMPSENPTDVV